MPAFVTRTIAQMRNYDSDYSLQWAKNAHFPYLNESDKYQIVAICNSSVESSKVAIKLYNLPEYTKAYGNPEGVPFSFLSLDIAILPSPSKLLVSCLESSVLHIQNHVTDHNHRPRHRQRS
jgi:hypothetical protein